MDDAVRGKVQSAAHQVWQAATSNGVRTLSPQMDFLLRLLSTGPYAASMILLTLQASCCPVKHPGARAAYACGRQAY